MTAKFTGWLVWLGMFGFLVGGLMAQGVQVDAQLSSPKTAVGQPVQLSILVEGARGGEVPRNFAVDGLTIGFRGQSTSVNMVNFQVSMIASYNFLVVPQRAGTFTIPSVAVQVDGRTYQTPALTLEVVTGGSVPTAPPAMVPPGGGLPSSPYRPVPQQATPAPSPPTQTSVPVDKVAFAELIMPDGEIYVGQLVPVEIRLFFDQRFRFEVQQMPTFSGEGFTAERLSEPVERTQMIDGVPYQVVSFHSAVTAVKTGVLQIPAVQMVVQVVVPSQRGGGSMFDSFFGGDPFGGMFGETRELNLGTKPVEVTVRALPTEGKPAGFAGAIGQFELEQGVSPTRGKVGEPLKLSLTLRGQGNFNRIMVPELMETDGWRIYPGGDQFEASDTVGFGGTKTFTVTVMPLVETDRTPRAEFSYFDPVGGKYVTLQTQSDVVAIEGGAVAAAPAGGAASGSGDKQPQVAEETEGAKEESPLETTVAEVAVSPAAVWQPGSFLALPGRNEFLAAHAAAAAAFFCFLAYLLLGVYQGSKAGELGRQRKRIRQLWSRLEGKGGADFYEVAREMLGLWSGMEGQVGAEYQWLERGGLPVELREGIRGILEAGDRMKYASAAGGLSEVEKESARKVLRELEQWMKSPGGTK